MSLGTHHLFFTCCSSRSEGAVVVLKEGADRIVDFYSFVWSCLKKESCVVLLTHCLLCDALALLVLLGGLGDGKTCS
jgi:hypothetical protein